MLDASDLAAAFRSVRTVMDHDSLFLFDVNHPEIYPECGASPSRSSPKATTTTSRSPRPSAPARRSAARPSPAGPIEGQRIPIDEHHRQRAYSEREITKALDAAGMAPVDVIDFDPYGEAEAVNARQ